MRSHKEQLESHVSEISSTVDNMRRQIATKQFSILPAALESLCRYHDQSLSLLRFLLGQLDHPENDFTNLI